MTNSRTLPMTTTPETDAGLGERLEALSAKAPEGPWSGPSKPHDSVPWLHCYAADHKHVFHEIRTTEEKVAASELARELVNAYRAGHLIVPIPSSDKPWRLAAVEELNFYIQESEHGTSKVPRQFLCHLQDLLRLPPDTAGSGGDVLVPVELRELAAASPQSDWPDDGFMPLGTHHWRFAMAAVRFVRGLLEGPETFAAPSSPAPSREDGWRDITVDVLTMNTSSGADYFTRITCAGREVTPYMFKERWKAEYEADHFKWIFGLRDEKPDLMAYGETTHPNPTDRAAPPAGEG